MHFSSLISRKMLVDRFILISDRESVLLNLLNANYTHYNAIAFDKMDKRVKNAWKKTYEKDRIFLIKVGINEFFRQERIEI